MESGYKNKIDMQVMEKIYNPSYTPNRMMSLEDFYKVKSLGYKSNKPNNSYNRDKITE